MESALENILTNSYKEGMISFMNAHPDLSHEIVFLTQGQYLDGLSSAVKKSVSGMIAQFTAK
jgi:hypothetical protein